MKKTYLWLLITCFLLSLSSCGEESSGGGGEMTPGGAADPNPIAPAPEPTDIVPANETVTFDQQDANQLRLSLGLNGGSTIIGVAEELNPVIVELCIFATVSAGGDQLVTTGTITQSGESFTYQAAPADRLRLELTGEAPLEFFVTQLNGDLSNLDRFFGNDHVLEFRLASGEFDLTLNSQRSGGVLGKLVRGFMLLNGTRFDVEVGSEEQADASVEPNSARNRSILQIAGTITADQYQLNLNERYDYTFIYVDNAVVTVTQSFDNRWTDRGQAYSLTDAVIQYSMLNGWPNEFDFWIAQGALTRDGAVIGQVGMERKPLWIEIFLQFQNGGRLELQNHALHPDDQR